MPGYSLRGRGMSTAGTDWCIIQGTRLSPVTHKRPSPVFLEECGRLYKGYCYFIFVHFKSGVHYSWKKVTPGNQKSFLNISFLDIYTKKMSGQPWKRWKKKPTLSYCTRPLMIFTIAIYYCANWYLSYPDLGLGRWGWGRWGEGPVLTFKVVAGCIRCPRCFQTFVTYATLVVATFWDLS